MLEEKVEDWWDNARQRMEIMGTKITQAVFRDSFMEKYFPENVRGKKEIEFLELKQGNSTVVEYAARIKSSLTIFSHVRSQVEFWSLFELINFVKLTLG